MRARDKVLPMSQLGTAADQLKSEDKKIVTTNGAFDLLHVGHIRALEAAKALGDVLIVGVNSDDSVRKYKSPLRPIVPQEERAELLAALSCVDMVSIFDETDPRAFIEAVQPHVHVKSGDYDPEKLIETETVRNNGGRIVIVPFVPGKSTTGIVERIMKLKDA